MKKVLCNWAVSLKSSSPLGALDLIVIGQCTDREARKYLCMAVRSKMLYAVRESEMHPVPRYQTECDYTNIGLSFSYRMAAAMLKFTNRWSGKYFHHELLEWAYAYANWLRKSDPNFDITRFDGYRFVSDAISRGLLKRGDDFKYVLTDATRQFMRKSLNRYLLSRKASQEKLKANAKSLDYFASQRKS